MLTCVTIFKTFQFICFQTRYKYTSQFRDSISNYVTSFVRLEIRDGSEKFGWIRVRFSMYAELFRSFPKSFPRLTKSYISVFSHMVFRDKSVNLFTFRFTGEKNIFLIDSIWVCFHVRIRDETNRASLSTMCCGQLDEGPGRKTRSRPSACKTHLASGIASGLCNFFAVSLYRSCYL